MDGQITIRAAGREDREFIASLVPSLLEFSSPAWDEPAALAGRYGEALGRAVDEPDPGAAVLVAEDEEGVRLGFISLRVARDAAGFQRGHVADLAVVEDARRLGVGRMLMQAGEDWTTERGLSMLSLDVWSTNERAIGFYRHLGYRPERLTLIRPL